MKGFILEDYHLALCEKLGWNDMLVQIAIPAIENIISSFIWMIEERHGETILPEEACTILLNEWDADSIFGLLCYNDDPNYLGSAVEQNFIKVRSEIEGFMREGFEVKRITR